MNQAAFLDLLIRFSERPLPAVSGRHVYLWHGDEEALIRLLPAGAVERLDLHALAANLTQAPRAVDAARRLLVGAIRSWLHEELSWDQQQILMVSGCDLLSRYGVPLGTLFEVSSESTAVVLAVHPDDTGFRPAHPLPDYISLNPRAPLEYLQGTLGEGAIISAEEQP